MYKETDYYGNSLPEAFMYENLHQPAYEGASLNYKMGLKGLRKGEPDTLAARELLYLQMRSSHMLRNNGIAKSARDKYVTNLGALTVKWKTKDGKPHPLMQELWDEFVGDPNLDGYGTFSNTQNLWHSSMFEAGNAFTRYQIRVDKNTNRIPLKLETITPQFHDVIWMGTLSKDKNIITKYGITFEDTKPLTYHFRKGIFEMMWLQQENPYNLIDIPADELIHMFIRDMPGQWLGLPFLSSIMIPLYELDELIDATVAKQQAAQAIAWIVTNSNPVALTPTGTPTVVKDKNLNDKIVFKAQGGSTQYLNRGEGIQFYQSTDIGANLQVLIKTEKMRIAAALGISYHELSGDTSGLDFSSIRALGIEKRVRNEFIHNTYTIPLGMTPVTNKFKALAYLFNKKTATAFPTYQMPRIYGVDELKDAQADLLEVMSGMNTLERILEERNLTFEEVLEDVKRNKPLVDAGVNIYQQQSPASQVTNNKANPNSSSN